MKKNCFQLAFLLTTTFLSAQVGINIDTPTEKLDVNGTLRVRALPNDGATNAIYTTGTNTNSGANPTQTFKAERPMVTDTNGVMGKTMLGELVPNNTSGATFDTTNLSTSMFVVKRFYLNDNLGAPATAGPPATAVVLGRYHPNRTSQPSDGIFNGDTGMEVSKWQAIISNISFKLRTATANTSAQFVNDDFFNYRIKGAANGNWIIVGDIINIQEEAYVDVLFIKSSVVAADPRNN